MQTIPSTAARKRALISILVVMLIWGSAFTVTKIAVREIPPLLLAFLRNFFASLILLPLYFARKKMTGQTPLPKGRIFLMGLTGITVFYALFNIALVHTSASAGSLIQGFIPVAVALGAAIFLHEKISTYQWAGIVLCVIGVALVGFVNRSEKGGNNLLGNSLMIISVFAWAAYTLIAKTMNRFDSILVVSMITFVGTLLFIPLVVIESWNLPLPKISFNAWLAVLYLGGLSSALSYVLYNNALKTLSAAQVGNFLNLDPVIGAIIAFIFLKDAITPLQIFGAVLVLAGILLSSR
ncbi:MAG: DMT family transporter, partial [Chitinophagaceae bacterium]